VLSLSKHLSVDTPFDKPKANGAKNARILMPKSQNGSSDVKEPRRRSTPPGL